MQKLVVYLGVIFICLISCTSSQDKSLTLARAIMDSHPDSALYILKSINTASLSKKQEALFALLYSQALDKNYIDVTSDSLISIAENYYSSTTDNQELLMLSYFYHGRIKMNEGDNSRALKLLTQCYNCANNLHSHFYMGRAADDISTIYERTFHSQDELRYAKLAYENLHQASIQPFVDYSLLSVARANQNCDNYSEAISVSSRLIDSAIAHDNYYLLIDAKKILAKSYYSMEQYDKAIDVLDYLEREGQIDEDLLGLLGLSYFEIGRKDLAQNCFMALSDSKETSSLFLTYQFDKKNNNYMAALSALENVYLRNDSVLYSSLQEDFSKELSDLYIADKQRAEFELKQAKMNRCIFLLVSAIILVTICIVSYRIYRKQTRIVRRNIILAQNLQEVLRLKETEFGLAQKSIRELLSTKYELFDNLCKTYYENISIGKAKRKISDEVESLINSLSFGGEKIRQMEMYVDANYSNIMCGLRADLPNLKEEDYLLFLYTILGFSISAIALFLRENNVESIYNRKARLKSKIKQLDIQKQQKYLSVMM